MNSKTLIQLSLVILILIIFSIFYKQYLYKDAIKITDKEKKSDNSEIEDNLSGNIIKDIIYKSEDEKGNTYTIKSEYGEFDNEESDIILMTKVSAIIELDDKTSISLFSLNARYNILNNDTNFFNNVKLDYLNHKIKAENIDVFFKDSKLEAYNNLVYRNLDLNLIADKVEVDLIEKNSKIFMFDNDKVKIFKK